ncbi:ABC transporter ATP-binding protein [Bacillus sp. CGMCC 1.16607]|uniref:ABC transporter ATP-binding protein n=1 Tax=Bacillus sp. CGMCC 1.16607 TaxID=3351842 RepID=UPI00362E3998
MNLAIETIGLTKHFHKVEAVRDVSIQVPEGSVFGLLGPNGAGKSALINMLMGIYQPTSGQGYVLGQSIIDPSGKARDRIGFISSGMSAIAPSFSVKETILLYSKLYSQWDWKRSQLLMDTFGLPKSRLVKHLSKGMMLQLSLLLCLSIRPKLLILDEPTDGLDPVMKQLFMQLIMQEAASGDSTVLFSTHQSQDLERMADYVAIMKEGAILLQQSIDDMKQHTKKIQAVFPEEIPAALIDSKLFLRTYKQGKIYTFITNNQPEKAIEFVRSANPLFLEVLDIDLEEIVIQTFKKEGYGFEPLVLD